MPPQSQIPRNGDDDVSDISDEEAGSGLEHLPSEVCEDDRCAGAQKPIWHCVDCDSSYCSTCWPLQGPHKPKKRGRDGLPHEKTDPLVARRLDAILNPTKDPLEIQRLHEADQLTKWFGVTKDSTGRPVFEDYGRYATLMSSISPLESMGNRYPQLVSFIGVTNAGKSSLIKMLIQHEDESRSPENRPLFPSPVVGSVINDSIPTSGDVNLYADPSTHAEQLPILFADCEGFEGGERTPLGAKSRRGDQDNGASSNLDNFHSRPITWAVTEEQRQREYAVTALYPRLLYTFSDCVVFVLRNAKTFQSAVLTKLLEWGVAALESAINAPALAHCIVALNGTDPGVDEREWDVNYATQSLLSSVKTALDPVEGVPAFRALADHWRALGKQIFSVEDLILRYYSSFKVIRIPSKPRYMTIDTQIGQLHSMIKTNVEDSFRTKRRARMLTNADELDVYLQSGFDHFTTYLNVPFNFMQVSLLHHAIPNDFGGHILQLCTTISAKQPNHQPGRVAWMFEKLSVMLASCVLLDCARFRKGRVDELFGSYVKFFDYAMSEYLELHYPCSYVSSDGTRRCQLVKARHLPKGHQDERGIIATGDYEAAFDSTFLPLWKEQLRAAIADIQRDFQYELEQIAHGVEGQTIPEERIALGLHVEYLNTFFETIGSAGSIVSHATCFCCLMDVPEHPLPCGHVLCSACTKAYSRRLNGHSATMSSCPLHQYSTKWAKPALIKFKPTGAGVRVLSLDGGGIRGIVQLEVLRAMEQVIGGFIPIQSFFDLIVGSGYGGMLAVGLATRDKSVDQCIDQFSAICDHAFQPRMKGVPVVTSIVAALGSGRRYKTKPLYAALKTAFGENDHLFDAETQFRHGSKVALVSTSATGRESILLASYRRSEDSAPIYHFERPHEPEMELKIWQSVAASIAHPGHVKAFTFHGQTYLDGGLRCGNPAHVADRERQLIWPDASEPDLFLSLGTGQNRITVLQKLSDKVPNGADAARKQSGRWRSKRLDDVLDAELAWTEFRSQAVRERSEAKGRRYIRFNPDLDKEPPAPDSKNDLVSLQNNVRKRLATPHRIAALRNVAHRLVASSFYLELQSKATAEQSEQICSASIVCRFEDGSAEMRGLGQILEDRMGEGFEPYFMIKPDMNRTEYIQKAPITKDITRALIDGGVFGLPNIYIPLRDESNPTSITLFLQQHDGLEPDGFPISGFPRVLLGEPKQAQPARKPVRASLDQRTRSEKLRSGHERGVSEVDTISLNGPDTGNNSSENSREDSRDAGTSPASAVRKQSLAEIIAQHQLQGSSIKQRTNRFWTYIGNNHMAQHPEMYSEAELAKFASELSNNTPTQTPRSAYPPVSHSPPPTGLGIQTSLDPIDTAPQMQQVDGTSVFPPSRYRLTNPDPGTTYPYPSEAGTDHSGDDDGSVYSAHDMVMAEPVQVRVAPSPTLIRHNQSRPNTPKSSGSADTFRTAAATLSGAELGTSPPPKSEAETLKPTVFVQPAKARRTHRSLPSTVLAEDFPRPPSMAESEVRRSVASASKVSPPPSEATYPIRGQSLHHSPVEDAMLPSPDTMSRLEGWLAQQGKAAASPTSTTRDMGGGLGSVLEGDES
ncbi:hypothetical protein B0A48_04482 [Cryoendolithus antarcticus]|uniref:PNPLA domain-containing protein n=1 Tax=Cryoendolithus antarcticus TaxID=1507870 RepID=A0A1V8TFH7_9PEZI|nr:hypothetical protein B0A48_04482 [Cryoendolithus antarcticus]